MNATVFKTSRFAYRGRRGSALLVVLWTVMVLAFAAAMASERIALIMGETSIRSKRFQAEMLADSAFSAMDSILKEERRKLVESKDNRNETKGPLDLQRFQGAWRSTPVEFGGGLYWIEVRDEQSKINWLKTPSSVWRNLFRLVDVPSETVDAWFDALEDWQNPGEIRRLNGAKTADYQNLKVNRRRSKNAPIADMGELYWVMGGDKIMEIAAPVDSRGKTAPLSHMTTIYGDGRINLNTAPPVLIAAALNTTLENAEMIVRTRCGPDGIEGTADDVFLDGIPQGVITSASSERATTDETQPTTSSVVTTSSSCFRVRGIGVFQGQMVVREALAVKDGEFGLRLLQDPSTMECHPSSSPANNL